MRTPAEYLAARAEEGAVPSAAWLVAEGDAILDAGAIGHSVLVPSAEEASLETIYDLASLTKPLVTSLLTILLAREERIDLSTPVRRFLEVFARQDKRDIAVAHLLTHTSGLPDWAPLYARGASIEEYLIQIGAMDPLSRPGTRVIYSDLGYIALGALVARIGSAPFEELARAFVLAPAGSKATFRPGPELAARVAASEESCKYEREKAGDAARGYTGWRSGVIRGEVHDQNAWAAGGAAGHAGLFGTVEDVFRVARQMHERDSVLLREGEAALVMRTQTGPLPEPRTMAWRVNRAAGGGPDPATAAGEALSAAAVGHNGFTGTSVWIDPPLGRTYVLLTNRTHPEVREDVDMNALRREFHRLAAGL